MLANKLKSDEAKTERCSSSRATSPIIYRLRVHRPYATSTSEHSVSIGIGAAHRRPGRGYMFGV